MKNLSITRVVLTFLFFSTSRSYSQNLTELANRDIISTYYWTDTSFRPYLIKLNYNLSSSFNLDSLNARITAIPINNNIFKKFAYVEKAYKEYSSILLKKYAIGFAHRDSIVNLSLLNGYSNILEVSSYWKAKTQNEYFPNDFKFVPFNFKNDTSFYSLRSFYEHLNNINAPKAWTISTGHPKITIGIVDNGVQNQPGIILPKHLEDR